MVEDGGVAERLSITPLNNPLRELETLMAAGASVRFRRPPDEVLHIQQILSTNLEPVIALTHGQLAGCLDAIKNRVLNWALALEAAGIQGGRDDIHRPGAATGAAGALDEHSHWGGMPPVYKSS
ncbi:hypothetical protein [Aeromonas caviae]|uniref:AbiTii domain-containing protein n=1 Tax=Aeromonas caviae TaxID=648 RepID=UPI00244208BB|nr:hypothetical protein [Aeromonas caviae]